MRSGMTLPPLQIVSEGVVQQPHVEVAELVLRFKDHKVADGLALIGSHFLVAVLVAVVSKTPHLGCNFGVGYFQMKMGNAGFDCFQLGQIVKGTI